MRRGSRNYAGSRAHSFTAALNTLYVRLPAALGEQKKARNPSYTNGWRRRNHAALLLRPGTGRKPEFEEGRTSFQKEIGAGEIDDTRYPMP